MRGQRQAQGPLFHSFQLEDLVPKAHPLRAMRKLADEELKRLSPRFEKAYSKIGRPSIPPEQLIKASLLQALYSIRSERQLCEQLGYNFLFRWFVGLQPEDPVWNPTTFTKNRDRFHEHGFLQAFFEGTVAAAIARHAGESEHFSVDGTLIQSWASVKSFRPKGEEDCEDENRWGGFRGGRRSNKTHESKTDPEARLMRKSQAAPAVLCHSLHAVMENRHSLLMGISVAEGRTRAETEEAERLVKRLRQRHWMRPKSVAADKGYDSGEFLAALEDLGVEPQVAMRNSPSTAQTRAGEARRRMMRREKTVRYRKRQRERKMIEKIFGWLKEIAGLKRARHVGRWKIAQQAYVGGAAYNLLRLSNVAAT